MNLNACHRCPARGPILDGLCRCTADGNDIILNAMSGRCPLGKFSAPTIAAPPAAAAPLYLPPNPTAQLWEELHRRPFAAGLDLSRESQWLAGWAKRIPCGQCRMEFQSVTKHLPPDFSSADNYLAWGVQIHNSVNRKLNRAEWTIDQARERWGTSAGSDEPPQIIFNKG